MPTNQPAQPALNKAARQHQDAVAEELGLSGWTLSRWKQQAARTGAVAAFRPVRVVAEGRAPGSPGALTVHGPAGLRVEGLTVEWVAALVKALRA